MYRLITCDLDETLLNHKRKVDKENVEAVRACREKGVKFVPASGRGYISLQGTLKELGLYQEPGEYVISFNGGAITENKDNRMLYFQGIPFEEARTLYRRGQDYDVCIHVYTKDMVYAYRVTQNERDYLASRMGIEEIFCDDIDFLRGQDIVKVLYVNTDRSYLNMIEEDLKDITGDMDVTYSSNRYIEFNHKGVNKGRALLQLAEILGIDPSETIAIGDNYNDLSMIKAAGLGVGVQNTVEGLKKECGYITDATCDESAVAEVIKKFVL